MIYIINIMFTFVALGSIFLLVRPSSSSNQSSSPMVASRLDFPKFLIQRILFVHRVSILFTNNCISYEDKLDFDPRVRADIFFKNYNIIYFLCHYLGLSKKFEFK